MLQHDDLWRPAIEEIPVLVGGSFLPPYTISSSLLQAMRDDLHGESKDTLEGDWESPCDLTAGVVESQTDPVGHHDTLEISME